MQSSLSELRCKITELLFLPCYNPATILFRNWIVINYFVLEFITNGELDGSPWAVGASYLFNIAVRGILELLELNLLRQKVADGEAEG